LICSWLSLHVCETSERCDVLVSGKDLTTLDVLAAPGFALVAIPFANVNPHTSGRVNERAPSRLSNEWFSIITTTK